MEQGPFWQGNALFASKAEINVLKKNSNGPKGIQPGVKKKVQKTLILVFEANSALPCQNGLFSEF